MTVPFNPEGDWAVWDGVTSVTYESTRRGGDPDVDTIANALARASMTAEGSPSYGSYQRSDLNWCLPASKFVAKEPKPGDVVVDRNSGRWTVLRANKGTLETVWVLGTRNLAVAYDLRDLIDVETAVVTKDEALAVVQNWGIRYTQLRARVQPLQDTITDERLVHATARDFRVIVERQLDVTNATGFDRIVFGGRYYEITAYRNPERIDELPVMEARLVP